MAVSLSVRRNIGLVALFSLLLALLPFGPSVTVASASPGALTVPETGGDTAPTSNWSYDASTGVLSVTGLANIAASYLSARLEERDLIVEAATIEIDADIVATAPAPPSVGYSLTLSTTGDIDVMPGRSLTTLGGNMSLLADSDGNGVGGIRIGDGSASKAFLTTNGGDLVLGGGDGSPNAAGLSAFRNETNTYFYSIGVESATLDAGGGDVTIRGSGGSTTAKVWCVQILDTVVTSGSGAITVDGDCGDIGAGDAGAVGPVGVAFLGTLQTNSGAISVTGISSIVRDNARGIAGDGTAKSVSGQILFRDSTANTSNIHYTGINLYGAALGDPAGGSSSDIRVEADKFGFYPNVNSAGTLSFVPAGSTFQSELTIPNYVTFSNLTGMTLGAAGNTQNIRIDEPFSVAGTLTIHSNGAVTQGAAVTATSLSLNGSGSFTLTDTSNNFGTVAGGASGSELGSVSVYDASGGLTVGAVGALEGISATGDILIETGSGDITLARSLTTASTSSSAITVNAGKTTAAGTASGGNIVVSGSPTVSAGAGSIVKLFSGSESASTGVTSLVGGLSKVKYGVDETSTATISALSGGAQYALYRSSVSTPQLTSLSNISSTAGNSSTLTSPTATNQSNNAVPGSVSWSTSNSSVASISGTTLTYGSAGTAVITATFTPTDTTNYSVATTTFTVTIAAAGGGGGSSSSSSSSAVTSPPAAPATTPRQTRLAPFVPNTSPVPRPVERLGLRFDPDAPSRATVGGAPANLVKTPVGSDGLLVAAGAFQFGVSLADADGAEVQTDTPSQSPELFVPRGQSAAVSGKGSYPGSFVQLFLPGNGNDSRELARIPVRSDGTFASDLSFQAGALELPVPIGRQVLQVVGYDELGNQTVVDMTVNIGQGVPAPEPNRQAGALPALTAGQSLATSGGIPETVSVTGVPEAGNVVVEGSGWVISVNADRDNGVVETTDGNVLVRLNPSSVGTTSGSGFLPGTLATVWLFSEPTLVATVSVDDAGEFSAEFLVDQRLIAPGEHTLQVQGVGSDGYIKAANLGVLVEEPVELTTESASGLLWWVVGAFVLALLFLLVLLARRRRSQEQ